MIISAKITDLLIEYKKNKDEVIYDEYLALGKEYHTNKLKKRLINKLFNIQKDLLKTIEKPKPIKSEISLEDRINKRKAKQQKYYAENAEIIKNKSKLYRENNKEKIKLYLDKKRNKKVKAELTTEEAEEESKRKKHEYYLKKKTTLDDDKLEEVKEARRLYYLQNKEKILERNKKNRELKKLMKD